MNSFSSPASRSGSRNGFADMTIVLTRVVLMGSYLWGIFDSDLPAKATICSSIIDMVRGE